MKVRETPKARWTATWNSRGLNHTRLSGHPGTLPSENGFAVQEVFHTALVVLGKCDSTHIHHFRPETPDSIADSHLQFLNANAESADVKSRSANPASCRASTGKRSSPLFTRPSAASYRTSRPTKFSETKSMRPCSQTIMQGCSPGASRKYARAHSTCCRHHVEELANVAVQKSSHHIHSDKIWDGKEFDACFIRHHFFASELFW